MAREQSGKRERERESNCLLYFCVYESSDWCVAPSGEFPLNHHFQWNITRGSKRASGELALTNWRRGGLEEKASFMLCVLGISAARNGCGGGGGDVLPGMQLLGSPTSTRRLWNGWLLLGMSARPYDGRPAADSGRRLN